MSRATTSEYRFSADCSQAPSRMEGKKKEKKLISFPNFYILLFSFIFGGTVGIEQLF